MTKFVKAFEAKTGAAVLVHIDDIRRVSGKEHAIILTKDGERFEVSVAPKYILAQITSIERLAVRS